MYKEKHCKYCDNLFKPQAPSNLYCCEECAYNGVIQRHYKSSYGITHKEVIALREKQNNLCAICGTEGFMMNNRVKHALNVDHDHETGTVRGLLCHNCNRGLGLFQDKIDILKKAIDYLESATTISKESTYKCTEAHNTDKVMI